jgi:hypothetical protein
MARSEVVRGYRSMTVGFSGVLGILAAAVQSRPVPSPEAELVETWKGTSGRRPQTMYRLTNRGRQRFAEYINVLEQVVADARLEAQPAANPPRLSGMDNQPYAVFTDNNLGSKPEYLRELCQALRPLEKIWSAAVSIDVTDDPTLVREMALAGCTGVFIGFESLDDSIARWKRRAGCDIGTGVFTTRRMSSFNRSGCRSLSSRKVTSSAIHASSRTPPSGSDDPPPGAAWDPIWQCPTSASARICSGTS